MSPIVFSLGVWLLVSANPAISPRPFKTQAGCVGTISEIMAQRRDALRNCVDDDAHNFLKCAYRIDDYSCVPGTYEIREQR